MREKAKLADRDDLDPSCLLAAFGWVWFWKRGACKAAPNPRDPREKRVVAETDECGLSVAGRPRHIRLADDEGERPDPGP